MKKIIYIFMLILSLLSWLYFSNNQKQISNNAKKYENIGDNYYENTIYLDAITNYKKSKEYLDTKNINQKILNSLYLQNNFTEAFEFSIDNNIPEKNIKEMQSKILEKMIDEEDYKNFNKYIKMADKEVYDLLEKKYKAEFIILGDSYRNINYKINDEIFIVSDGKYEYCIDENGKRINSMNFSHILGTDNGFLTTKNDGENLVYDFEGSIRAKISYPVISYLKEEKILVKEKNTYFYIDRSGRKLSKNYKKASNFENNMALVLDNNVKLIDKNFNVIKEFDDLDFKINKDYNAIFDNKIILIGKKYKMYDIVKEKISKEYQDIDFSYNDLIAIKSMKKWGYMNQNFEEVINFKFDEANSFSINLGLVKVKDKTYIIDNNENILRTVEETILPFTKNGISFMKKDNEYIMIKLVRNIND